MNIMLVSVTERAHEIGIRLSVGAPLGHHASVLGEAVMICALGGLTGVLGSWAAGNLFAC